MANSVRWYGGVLRRVLYFEVEGQMKKGRLMGTWKMQVEEEIRKVGLSMMMHFANESGL